MLGGKLNREPESRLRQPFRLTRNTLFLVAIGAAILTVGCMLTIVSASSRNPPTFWEFYRWQFSTWAVWILLVAPTHALFSRLMSKGLNRWQLWLSVVIIGLILLTLHALWIGFGSTALSPYRSLSTFRNAIYFHVPFGLPINLAIISWLAAMASRPFTVEVLNQKAAAERALAESEQRFRDFFEQAVFGMFRSTPEGQFLMLNQAAASAMGYEEVPRALNSIRDIGAQIYADPDDRKRYLDTIRRDGSVTNWIWKMRCRDGSVVWNSETSRGVFDIKGELQYLEGTIKDITAEVEARAALEESERRSAELRAQLADAQLRALKLQIKPHFLFNVLNTVVMMIRTGETANAQQAVTMLATMFRRFLEFEGEDTVTLEQEIGFVEQYLGLERFRFEDRVALTRDIAPDTLQLEVPTLILQPLVENAVKHGSAHMTGLCNISLASRREHGFLVIEIGNDVATGNEQPVAQGHGIGLRNTRSRLTELYGDRGSLDLIKDGARVRAVVRIPIRG